MRIKELIERLQGEDPEATVFITAGDGTTLRVAEHVEHLPCSPVMPLCGLWALSEEETECTEICVTLS
jgi:hypothetical protein